jgi:hypothetical protein
MQRAAAIGNRIEALSQGKAVLLAWAVAAARVTAKSRGTDRLLVLAGV